MCGMCSMKDEACGLRKLCYVNWCSTEAVQLGMKRSALPHFGALRIQLVPCLAMICISKAHTIGM